MSLRGLSLGRRVVLALAQVVLTAFVCAGLLVAAVLVPAPAPVLPGLVVVCIGGPIAAGCELRAALGAPGALAGWRAVAELRAQLKRLPEARHPLGL